MKRKPNETQLSSVELQMLKNKYDFGIGKNEGLNLLAQISDRINNFTVVLPSAIDFSNQDFNHTLSLVQ